MLTRYSCWKAPLSVAAGLALVLVSGCARYTAMNEGRLYSLDHPQMGFVEFDADDRELVSYLEDDAFVP